MIIEDEVLTEYMGSVGRHDASADDIEHTYVFGPLNEVDERVELQKLTCVLERQRTGEQMFAELPAVVGRGREANVKISGNLAISRTHAKLQEQQGRVFVIDLGSTNGTRVRGERIAAQVPVEVRDGECVCFASEAFVLRMRVSS